MNSERFLKLNYRTVNLSYIRVKILLSIESTLRLSFVVVFVYQLDRSVGKECSWSVASFVTVLSVLLRMFLYSFGLMDLRRCITDQ